MSGYTIEKPSTELMQNYLQSEIVDPTEQELRSVETSAGAALFSIGTERSLYVTAELPGDAGGRTGWQQFNLSAAAPDPLDFSRDGAQCSKFDVARCSDGTLRVAMALCAKNDENAKDALFLATIKAGTEKAWFKSPTWTQYRYDEQKNPRTSVRIVNVFLSEATDGDYTVVDIKDTPDRPQNISRYYIDADHKEDDPAWQPHPLAIEVQADKYTSCLGRRRDHDLDGIYTSGHEGDRSQLVYTPVRGRKGHTPLPDSLHLPGDLVPDAISSCRNPDNSSGLYAAAAGGLYYFASDNQHDGATAIAVISGNSLFDKVDRLFASHSGSSAMVWGLNADKQVFYVTCPVEKLTDPGAWSVPLPIMSGVQQIAPFVNRANSANTFFAHTAGNELKIAVKRIDAKSPGSRAWSIRDVHLPLPDTKKKQRTPARQFHSYTTHVKVTEPSNRPAADKLLSISAPRGVTSVYINNLYYALGAAAIHVPTDASGSVTIIEPISRLDGTQLQIALVGEEGSAKVINPMQDAPTVSERLRTLRTRDGLVNATIRYQNEKKNPPRKLVKQGASYADVTNAATNIDHLWKANDQLSGKMLTAGPSEPSERYKTFVKGATPIKVDAGDLLLLLESGHARRAARARAGMVGAGESWWDIIVEFFEGLWRFVVKIGEAIFYFVLEVIEDVFAAFKYVFDKIVETIEDIIEFVKFLFELDDLQRTKDVLQHLADLFLKDQVAYISTVRKDFDVWIASAIKEITDWASPKGGVLASPGRTPATMGQLLSSSQPAPASASDSYLAYHFCNNIADALRQGEPVVPPDGTSSLLVTLANLAQQEFDALRKAATDLLDLAKNFDEKKPNDAVRQLIAILAKAVLETLKNVVDALLALIEHIVDWARRRFAEDPLYIPIVSEILEAFGVPDFTVLDLVCWLAAIPLTIGYKIATGNVPFPDNELTTFLRKDATDFASVVKRLSGVTQAGMNVAAAATVKGADSASHCTSASFHMASSFIAGVLAVAGAVEAVSWRAKEPASPFVTGIISFCGAFDNLCRYIALAVVPRVPSSDPGLRQGTLVLRSFVLGHKLIFGGISVVNRGETDTNFSKLAMIGPGTDPFLVALQTVFTVTHFVEIAIRPSYTNDVNLGCVDETSNVCNYLARLFRDFAVISDIPDPEVKVALGALTGTFRGLQGVLQLSEGVAELALDWPA